MGRPVRAAVVFVLIAVRAGAQSVPEPDTEFIIRLVREPGPGPSLSGRLVTTRTYPCEGYDIRSRVTRERDTISIRIEGLRRPVPCLQTFSEATGTVFLGALGGGTYVLRVTYRGTADLYRLTVHTTGPVTRPIKRHFTTIKP